MEYDAEKKEIRIDKVFNVIDRFAVDFIPLLEKYTSYVIVSGYVAILLGRTRSTEDVDLLIPPVGKEQFITMFGDFLKNDYECANTSMAGEAYELMHQFALRFFKRGEPTPNIEFKLIKTDLDKYSFEHRMKVVTGNVTWYIAPLELQIPFKLFLAAEGTDEELASDKDIEDARFLYRNFKDNIHKEEFDMFIEKLHVRSKLRWLS